MEEMNGRRAISLLELVICICLIGLLVSSFYTIENFSRNQLLTADQRSKVLNEVTLAIKHMNKNLIVAIGNPPGVGGIDTVSLSKDKDGKDALWVYIDSDSTDKGNGIFDAYYPGAPDHDKMVGYRINGTTLEYCGSANHEDPIHECCKSCPPWEPVARGIISSLTSADVAIDHSKNYITVRMEGCWDTSKLSTCGDTKNPSVSINSSISMPSVPIE